MSRRQRCWTQYRAAELDTGKVGTAEGLTDEDNREFLPPPSQIWLHHCHQRERKPTEAIVSGAAATSQQKALLSSRRLVFVALTAVAVFFSGDGFMKNPRVPKGRQGQYIQRRDFPAQNAE